MLKGESHRTSSSRADGILLSPSLRRRSALLLLLVVTAGQGCFTYQAAELPEIRTGEEVRIVLEEEGYRRVAPGAQQGAAPRFEGRLFAVTPDSLTLSVWIGEAYQGTPFYSTYQNLMLPLEQIRSVEHRRLSKGRTALVAGGVMVLIGVLIESVGFTDLWGGDGGGGPPDPPEPVGFRGTVFR